MMRALVTGGAGFIGSNLVDRLLAEGHAVEVVDDLSTGSLGNLADARSDRTYDLRVHHVDIRSPEVSDLIARREPEVVFHLAAHTDVRASMTAPSVDAAVNVVGTVNVLEGARRAGSRKVVFATSGAAVYGEPDPADLPVRESHPQQPLSPHGVAKKAAADYLRAYRAAHGLEFTALALADVYGPRQDPAGSTGVVATFTRRVLAGEPCTLVAGGAPTRDFVYVDDVVDALVRAATRGTGLLCNIGTGVETSIADLHRVLVERAGVASAPTVTAPARPGEPARIALSPGRAAIHLGWRPWTPLADGVDDVLRWLRPRL